VIWEELRFDKLVGSNLQICDFSDWLNSSNGISKEDGFSVVVGNPPFQSKLNDAAKRHRAQQKRSAAIPDNQMAYFIVEQATPLLKRWTAVSDSTSRILVQRQGPQISEGFYLQVPARNRPGFYIDSQAL